MIRNVRYTADLAADVETAHLRHTHIEQHQVGGTLFHRLQHASGVVCLNDLVPGVFEQKGRQFDARQIIVSHQDLHRFLPSIVQ
jgi:hypothetical protein